MGGRAQAREGRLLLTEGKALTSPKGQEFRVSRRCQDSPQQSIGDALWSSGQDGVKELWFIRIRSSGQVHRGAC